MIKAGIARLFNSLGYRIVRTELGFSRPELETYQQVQEYTATTIERLVGLVDAVRYVSANRIEGDVVECGVWRGGSIMAAMHALIKMGDLTRHFHLFENDPDHDARTFERRLPTANCRIGHNVTAQFNSVATVIFFCLHADARHLAPLCMKLQATGASLSSVP